MEAENLTLKKTVSQLSVNINHLDQYGRNKNIEIHGIQERHNENLKEVVLDIAKNLQIPCSHQDIDIVHRLPSQTKKRKAIIVQFSSRTLRNEWLKKRRTGLVSNNIISGSDDQPVFVNVNLSPKNKELFWKARLAKGKLNYKYCWVNGSGTIFLKRSDESNVITITNEEDIPSVSHIVAETTTS